MKKISYIILAFLILFSSWKTLAQEVQRQPILPESQIPSCPHEITESVKSKTDEFSDFMNQHFSSKKNTSDLMETAIKKFREHIKTSRGLIVEADKYIGAQKTQVQGAILRSKCEQIIEDEIFVAKEIIKTLAIRNAQAKKTTKLLDKYKEINSKLDRLNFQMAQMYGYLQTFSQKLPCYVAKCN